MDKKTKGSWLVYQTGKLQSVTDQSNFESSYVAGKAGILLSAISQDSQATLDRNRLNALARASGINTLTELPILLGKLEERSLVNVSDSGVDVLGVTSASCLNHTAEIFDDLGPTNIEIASLELCEGASVQPQLYSEVREKLSDSHHLSATDASLLLDQSCEIGFVDTESVDKTTRLLFNGNLFRRDDIAKVNRVLMSLSNADVRQHNEFSDLLMRNACVSVTDAERVLGKALFEKLASVGIYDINVVSNSSEEIGYVTRPSAFSKFSNSMVDDAFDLAKMFVSSLTYGMTRSSSARGQIQMIEALMRALIAGQPVGPVPAIGEDYKILEMKHVVQVYSGTKGSRTGYLMRLLKKEVGQLALEVIKNADASQHSLSILPTAAVNRFRGPEKNRASLRRRELERDPQSTNEILLSLRTGGRSR